ncbi:MAG TPA: hypothetical protein VI279_05990 [Rhodocyclaceae bacterium]
MTIRIFALLGLALLASFAWAAGVAERDGLLTDAGGRTLYVFDKDGGGKSSCNGGCANVWPPLGARPDDLKGDLSAINRDDGSRQLSYKGRPLYLYSGDSKPGDTHGDGQGGVWHAVRFGGKAAAPGKTPEYSMPSY